jgi:hypothetical protein
MDGFPSAVRYELSLRGLPNGVAGGRLLKQNRVDGINTTECGPLRNRGLRAASNGFRALQGLIELMFGCRAYSSHQLW